MKILVIEDDPTVGQFVKRGFEEHRWGVDLVANGDEGEARAIAEEYDVVVLDMRLPGKPGAQVLHDLRSRGFDRPILILTAQDAIDAKVESLRAGADDYVTKPFAFEELLARVEALSRRPRARMSPALKVADLTLNLDTREVARGGAAIEVTPKEYTVLEYLMRHAGRVMSRTLITEYAWGYHFDPGTNIVDVVINHLRKKIDANTPRKLIHTIRGVGYVIRDESTSAKGS
jgi:two-component system copper resistance phosphate regulon response regulator CusR